MRVSARWKLAAASLDDVAAAAGKAGTKAAGVVIDDTAVTPGYVIGFEPKRELPIVGKIAAGSLRNKLLILLPAALLLMPRNASTRGSAGAGAPDAVRAGFQPNRDQHHRLHRTVPAAARARCGDRLRDGHQRSSASHLG